MFTMIRHEFASGGGRTSRWRRPFARLYASLLSLLVIGSFTACSPDKVTGHLPLPGHSDDPDTIKAIQSAITLYNTAQGTFRTVSDMYIPVSGLLADELNFMTVSIPPGVASSGPEISLDSRVLPEFTQPGQEFGGYADVYSRLQRLRTQTSQALGLLHKHARDSTALRGHLYAVHAYAMLMLADLFCSGVPLSTVAFDGTLTFKPGIPTTEVYFLASVYFDTALLLAADSTRVINLARVGKARALLSAGDFAGANQVAMSVVDRFAYHLQFPATGAPRNFAQVPKPGMPSWAYTVADREGTTGLDYRSSGDRRTVSSVTATNTYGGVLYHPNKYSGTGDSPITVADWVEARLIRAEVALRNNQVSSWLTFLNTLRRTAITPALRDTTDPGTPEGRLRLMFRERAFWLFLTGHRQGDMRRLIRQYGWAPATVYPILDYPAGGTRQYGGAVNTPVPATERLLNKTYTGCQHRDA